jgi:hypothetical protein
MHTHTYTHITQVCPIHKPQHLLIWPQRIGTCSEQQLLSWLRTQQSYFLSSRVYTLTNLSTLPNASSWLHMMHSTLSLPPPISPLCLLRNQGPSTPKCCMTVPAQTNSIPGWWFIPLHYSGPTATQLAVRESKPNQAVHSQQATRMYRKPT